MWGAYARFINERIWKMNNVKQISVIVPIYNVEKYLDKCLNSLKNQNFESYEVIMVDDGATDNSRSIAEYYETNYGNIFTLVSQTNKGLSEARNTGMRYATGEYICFVDSDDYVEETYLQELYKCIKEHNADLIFCAFRSVDEEGNMIREVFEKQYDSQTIYTLEKRKDLLLTQNAAWNKLYKRQIIIDNELWFTPGVWYEDLRFVKKYMLFASRFVYCDTILYNYLIRKGSIMNSMGSSRNIEIISAIDEIIDFYKERKLLQMFHEEIEFLAIDHMYISTLVRLIRAKERAQLEIIKKSFVEHFPKYKKNKYIKRLEKGRKLILFMLDMRLYGMIRMVFGMKEKKNV